MEFVTDFEQLVRLAWRIGLGSLILVVLLMIQILVLRSLLVRREKRAKQVLDIWQPILVASLDRIPEEFPPLRQRDMMTFLIFWNYLHESLRDDTTANLNVVAKMLDIDSWSIESLQTGNIREKLLAIQTLGWLQEHRAWKDLEEIMHSEDPIVSLSAAKALMRIDPEEAIEMFLPLVVQRGEWSYAMVGKILKETGAGIVSEPLARTALEAPEEFSPRVIRFLGIAHRSDSAPVIHQIISNTSNIEVIMTCLRVLDDPGDLDMVRDFLKHEHWRVRTQAAICLGRIGTEEDVKRLAHAAGDQEWWVRYRAAQALANLPKMTSERLEEIAENHSNFFGSDIIHKVNEERSVMI